MPLDAWRRVMDVNDRALRSIVVGLGVGSVSIVQTLRVCETCRAANATLDLGSALFNRSGTGGPRPLLHRCRNAATMSLARAGHQLAA